MATSIALSSAVAQYVRAWHLAAVCLQTRKLILCPNPDALPSSSVTACWWTADIETAKQLVADSAGHAMTPAKANLLALKLRLRWTPHDIVVQRAQAALGELHSRAERANANGDFKAFNRAYRAYRLVAEAKGQRFMSYNQARAKLQAALTAKAASRYGGVPDEAALIALVFG